MLPSLALACLALATALAGIAACAGDAGHLSRTEELRLDGGLGCSACHREQALDVRASRFHRGRPGEPACLVCHSEHAAGTEVLPGPSDTVACELCHVSVRAEFDLPFAHPLDGSTFCTSCHAPHGGNARRVRDELHVETCVECHQEQRGPFVFEHDGNRVERCVSCHEPHGSANRRLLTQARTSFLCTKCHIGIELIHPQLPGSPFLECLECHVEVHGSNWDRFFFR